MVGLKSTSGTKVPLEYNVTTVGNTSVSFNGTYSLTSLRVGAISCIKNHEDLYGPMHAVCQSDHDHR